MAISVAMEVLWTTPSPMLKPPQLNSKLTTDTPEPRTLAHTQLLKVNSRSLHSTTSLPTLNQHSKLLLLNNQCLLPSKPTKLPSNFTSQESFHQDAEPTLTTVSSLLDMELMLPSDLTTLLRTPGAQPGVRLDMSDLPSKETELEFAESNPNPHTQLFDQLDLFPSKFT
jgi:hypothetical protein